MFGFVLFIGVLLFFAWLDSGSSDSGNNSLSNSSRNNSSTSMTRQFIHGNDNLRESSGNNAGNSSSYRRKANSHGFEERL